MVANLAELNRLRREKLKDIAAEFGCELLQTFDRAWFANAFRANPDWRLTILGVAGGPFSLSREPRAARPDADQLQTIGRDELLAKASGIDADLVLWS